MTLTQQLVVVPGPTDGRGDEPRVDLPDQRIAMLAAHYAPDPEDRVRQEAARRTARLMSVLGTVAVGLSVYDLVLLTTLAGH